MLLSITFEDEEEGPVATTTLLVVCCSFLLDFKAIFFVPSLVAWSVAILVNSYCVKFLLFGKVVDSVAVAADVEKVVLFYLLVLLSPVVDKDCKGIVAPIFLA